ncbi:universal stress protein [Halorarius litoreus]|uniref:universal stress protein n=1 Tax=Halorarius litoreus TaxID=2962676 RepID=UPI0020CE23CE|nr:universal stress protein [Halorarius litoreus]
MTIQSSQTAQSDSKYRVLVPIDMNEADALAQARYVASLPDAPSTVAVTLTHVLHGEELDTPPELQSAQRVGAVKRAREWLVDHGIETEIRDVDLLYPLKDGIISLAETIDADAIVLSGRKRGAVGMALFGSQTQAVLRHTTRPVVVVDPDEE